MGSRVGIIVHSFTGNTLSVANQLRESLLGAGHAVVLNHLDVVDEDPSSPQPVQLRIIPDPTGFDLLVLAGPVRGFSASPALMKYLETAPGLNGVRVACFVTEYFPFPWMGGNRAVGQVRELAAQRGGDVVASAVVNWSSSKRGQQITDLIDRFAQLA